MKNHSVFAQEMPPGGFRCAHSGEVLSPRDWAAMEEADGWHDLPKDVNGIPQASQLFSENFLHLADW